MAVEPVSISIQFKSQATLERLIKGACAWKGVEPTQANFKELLHMYAHQLTDEQERREATTGIQSESG